MVGLGLGPKQLPYRGPGPPPADWDGLSVVVWNVPRKATQQQIVAPWTWRFSPKSWMDGQQFGFKTDNPLTNVNTDIPVFVTWIVSMVWIFPASNSQQLASKAAMSKQGCKVQSAYRLQQQKGRRFEQYFWGKLSLITCNSIVIRYIYIYIFTYTYNTLYIYIYTI